MRAKWGLAENSHHGRYSSFQNILNIRDSIAVSNAGYGQKSNVLWCRVRYWHAANEAP